MTDYRGSFNRFSEIAMGSMDAVGEAINQNEAASAERAPQQPPGISRVITADIQKVVNFESPREYWDSLPIVSKLFMFMTFIDVAMVIFYSIWQFIEMFNNDSCTRADCAEREEHLHVVLGMLITAFFLVIFVVDAISQENDFELLACLLLTIVIAARVIYFILHAHYDQWARILGIVVVACAAVVTTLLGCLTYNKFGWRVYSRLACDLRLKHAAERTVMYFAQNRFATLVKLDFQFMVLTMAMGIVMSVQKADISVEKNDYTLILCICTGLGFVIGLPWLSAAYYAVHKEHTSLAEYLRCLCIFTLLPPIGAVVAVYLDTNGRKRRDATESLLISTILLVLFRFSVLYYMVKLMTLSIAKQEQDKSDKSDFSLRFRMSNKNPDLLPLLKGAWLIKQSPTSPNKRRFFQLSQDYTTLRWAWNSYVLLYYVDDIETNDVTMTITLRFSIEPELVVRFETMNDYETWKRGFHVLLALLMAPDTELERESRIHVDVKNKRKGDNREQSFTFEAFLNRLGVTTRNHAFGSRHPLREAEQELKKKMDSRRTAQAGTADSLTDKLQKAGSVDSIYRQSSRIPSAKQDADTGLYNQPSLDSQGGTSADGDSGTPSLSSDLNVGDTPQGILPGMQTLVETIDYCDLDFGKFLGSGAEGAVWAAWYLDTPVAVKKTNSVHELEMTMYAGQHDNVVGLRGLAKEGSATYIVLEYCPRGTLDVLLHHTMTSRWDPRKVLQMIRCIARGILHLHSRKPAILHRDLKPANVFVSHGLVLKIGDFGMSRQLKPLQSRHDPSSCGPRIRRTLTPGVIGTASYTAPELLDERLQTEGYDVTRFLKADVYSFGVTMWEIVRRERPFEGMQFYEIVAGWSSDPESMKLEPFSIPKDLSGVDQKVLWSLQELMTECTSMNPDRRPDMKSVVKRLKELHVQVTHMAAEAQV